jgi:hypothetical protein
MTEETRRAAWQAEDESELPALDGTRRDIGTSATAEGAGKAEDPTSIRAETGGSPPPRPGTRESPGHTGVPGATHDTLREGVLTGGPREQDPGMTEVEPGESAPRGVALRASSHRDVEGGLDDDEGRKRLAPQVDPL